jgi:beta-N-acetylglucosaminidase
MVVDFIGNKFIPDQPKNSFVSFRITAQRPVPKSLYCAEDFRWAALCSMAVTGLFPCKYEHSD